MSNRPAAYRHTLLMEGGQKSVRLTTNKKNPFGKRGEDYSREYEVVTVPMYTRAPSATSAGVDEVARDAALCTRNPAPHADVPMVPSSPTIRLHAPTHPGYFSDEPPPKDWTEITSNISASMRSVLDTDAKDAARYRHICANLMTDVDGMFSVEYRLDADTDECYFDKDDLDEVVDAAIQSAARGDVS